MMSQILKLLLSIGIVFVLSGCLWAAQPTDIALSPTTASTSSVVLSTNAPRRTTAPSLVIPTDTARPTRTETATPLPPSVTSTPDIWQIQPCQKGPTAINYSTDWMWEFWGDVDQQSDVAALLNYTENNEILGFYFDSAQARQYQIYGCVVGRFITIWLQQNNTVEAILQGEFPLTDPRRPGSTRDVSHGDVISGSLVEKSNPHKSFSIYLDLISGTAGNMEHRFWLAGVDDDTVILNAARQFLTAIANDERAKVAEMMSFPVRYRIGRGELLDIQTPESFLEQYDALFDAGFRARLAKTFPDYLRAEAGNFIGYIAFHVIGGGGITFDKYGKIVAIYNWEKPTPTAIPKIVPTMITETASPTASITPVPLCNDQPIPEIQLETALGSDVLLAGTAYLCDYYPYSALDLDRAIVGNYFFLEPETNLKGADIELSLLTVPGEAGIFSIDPIVLANFDGKRPPNQVQCEAAIQEYPGYGGVFFSWSDDITDVHMYNEFACIRTDEGRIGYIHLEEANPLGEVSVKISFVVWKNR